MDYVEQKITADSIVLSVMPPYTELETVKEHYSMLLEGDYPKPLLVLIDCTHTTFKFHPKDFDNFMNLVKECISKYGEVHEAIHVQSAYETAVADVFQSRAQYDDYSFEVFSTEEGAREWLASHAR